MSGVPGSSRLRIALVLPDLLGTYGDRGNAVVLQQRLRWRGLDCELVDATADTSIPAECDIYVIGGGEDGAQVAAVRWLRAHSGLARAVERGATVLAVCAGFQALGTAFTGTDGTLHGGLGLFDATTEPLPQRATGEVLVAPAPELGLGTLTGFENHRGGTRLGTGTRPLGRVVRGVGNGVASDEGTNVEGVVQGRLVGTYLHGPVLARNPDLADLLLTWATGETLPPLVVEEAETLHHERLASARTR